MTVKLSEELLHDALASGLHRLVNYTLPSQWSKRGCGWQELWQEAPYAGFYASCDGISLIYSIASSQDQMALKLARCVFCHHVRRVVDASVNTRDPNKTFSRRTAASTTMKVAKFLHAYVALGAPQEYSHLAQQYSKLLVDGSNEGTWGFTLHTGADARPAPTVEAAVALAKLDPTSFEIEKTISYLAQLLDCISDEPSAPIESEGLIALWGLSMLLSLMEATTHSRLADTLNIFAKKPAIMRHELWVEHFTNRSSAHHDYYSLNLTLLFASTVLNLYQNGIIPLLHVEMLGPLIYHLATETKKQGYFKSPNNPQLRFWEYNQAMTVMYQFAQFMAGTKDFNGGPFMYVAPNHFRTTHFVTDPNLIVVLMPFAPDWSEDVFHIFKSAGQSRGYTVWRADQEFTDDNIMQTIWNKINQAKLVIADCTGRNPNVFYELGICHTIGKPVFICTQRREAIPFDIGGIRSFEYKILPSGLRSLETRVGNFIDQL